MKDIRMKILKHIKKDCDKFCKELEFELAAYSDDVYKYLDRTLPRPFNSKRRATAREIRNYNKVIRNLTANG